MKRYRRPKVVEGQMKMQRGRLDSDAPDMLIFYGDNTPRCDRVLAMNVFCEPRLNYMRESSPSFIEELEARGYDLDSLKFSIERKAE